MQAKTYLWTQLGLIFFVVTCIQVLNSNQLLPTTSKYCFFQPIFLSFPLGAKQSFQKIERMKNGWPETNNKPPGNQRQGPEIKKHLTKICGEKMKKISGVETSYLLTNHFGETFCSAFFQKAYLGKAFEVYHPKKGNKKSK